MSALDEILLQADQWWVYPAAALFIVISGLLPPVPSTSVFVALGALAGAEGGPHIGWLLVAMAGGALLGDLLTFLLVRSDRIGALLHLAGVRWQRAIDGAQARMTRQGVSVLMVSRFIPLGRISTNIVLGLGPRPLPQLMGLSFLASVPWTVYAVGIGVATRFWPNISTTTAVVVAVVLSIALGWLIGKLNGWSEPEVEPEPEAVKT